MARLKRVIAYEMPNGQLVQGREAAAAAFLLHEANAWSAASFGHLTPAMADAIIENRAMVRALFDELDQPEPGSANPYD